jgi:hypothetical protein
MRSPSVVRSLARASLALAASAFAVSAAPVASAQNPPDAGARERGLIQLDETPRPDVPDRESIEERLGSGGKGVGRPGDAPVGPAGPSPTAGKGPAPKTPPKPPPKPGTKRPSIVGPDQTPLGTEAPSRGGDLVRPGRPLPSVGQRNPDQAKPPPGKRPKKGVPGKKMPRDVGAGPTGPDPRDPRAYGAGHRANEGDVPEEETAPVIPRPNR